VTRIIAGTAGGRRLRTPRGPATRPTTDRVREALFSRVEALLGLEGARVLDLYAGSGALGLEAASRGAAHVLCVEADRPTARLVRDNVSDLGLAQVDVAADKVERVLARGPAATAYDLVLADPPYPLGEDALAEVLAGLVDQGWLADDAVVVVERSSRSPEPTWPAGLRLLRTRTYGETALHLAERLPAPGDRIADMADYTIPRPTSGDVVDLILDDHRLFEALLRDMRDATADRAAARAAFSAVLIAHGEAEETEVYPNLERKDAISEEEVEHGEHEHAEGNEALLALLECVGTDTQKFDDAVEKMTEALMHHLGEEEQTILNPARTEVSDQVRADLGMKFLAARSKHLDADCGSIDTVREIVERDRRQGKIEE
jgi:16S rRNA (guanine(966)-N(2))-methyltransferase RsmD